MIHPVVLSLPPVAIIAPRPRRHRHHTTTPSRSLHRHRLLRLTPLLASCVDRRPIVCGPDMGLFTVTKQATTPFDCQKPGTSGLRKKVSLSPPDLCLRSLWLSADLSVSVMRRVRARLGCLGSAARHPWLPATSRISPGGFPRRISGALLYPPFGWIWWETPLT